MNNRWKTALVQGASRGIGLEFVRQLRQQPGIVRVIATCRNPADAAELQTLSAAADGAAVSVLAMNIEQESSIEAAFAQVKAITGSLDLLINCSGLLHDPSGMAPERRLEQLDAASFQRSFAVNAAGPALVVKHSHKLLRAGANPLVASLSARVGSITDNRLGGWYAYRASKAAQNMLTRCMAIELGRGSRPVSVVALHPGTVDTDLSRPFHKNVPDGKLFSVDIAVQQLIDVISTLDAESTGRFFAWDGSEIPW